MTRKSIVRDRKGAVLVEVTLVMTIMLVFIFGSIDFLFAFYQWNAAAKAVQIGLRIAAVSDPVANGLDDLSTVVANPALPTGSMMPLYVVTCDGHAESCTCIMVGGCPEVGAYNPAAMNTIVFGRGSSSCSDATSFYDTGMCDIFPRITADNVVVTYTQTGLGYVGRPGGPVPTITISLQYLPFQFFFLSAIRGLRTIPIPPLTSSITAEDLSSGAPSP
jgi:hypothetical protein